MGIQCSWLTKKWVIDASTLTAINEFSLIKELDIEEGEAKDGKNPTTVKGYKPQSLTTMHKVSKSTGTDPLQEFNEWTALVGKRGGFHIEGKRIGPPALILDKVFFTANAISNTGVILDADIELTFNEDVNFAKAPAVAVEKYVGDTATPENAPGYRPNGVQDAKSAYNVRPTASAAEAKE